MMVYICMNRKIEKPYIFNSKLDYKFKYLVSVSRLPILSIFFTTFLHEKNLLQNQHQKNSAITNAGRFYFRKK